jgi:hypothetical protein
MSIEPIYKYTNILIMINMENGVLSIMLKSQSYLNWGLIQACH